MLWQTSQHALSMQHASTKSVLGDFDNATFNYFGITSRFFKKADAYFVRTDGADGKLADFQVKFTFGVYPLQQYLVEFPDGRVQALGLAWDSRSKAEGGHRWFHLYPKPQVKAGENVHWASIDQNWNFMCAECHSTHIQKNFDLASNRFTTGWSEINVACEACHGPGSAHVAWANQKQERHSRDNGLLIHLTAANRTQWHFAENQKIATPVVNGFDPKSTTELCSRCHSRRSQLAESNNPAQTLLDSHQPELLTSGNYFADGQMQDEVFNYGSFLQSKMYQYGVTCTNCHDPHTLKLREDGNKVCTQCHRADVYDSEKHHFHQSGTQAAQCASCHMPTQTYMVVDQRHDHSFRIPRPDLTKSLGIPNTCNNCHSKQKPEWALAKITHHSGHPPSGFQNYADVFHRARAFQPDAASGLMQLAENAEVPAIARASALWELRNYLIDASIQTLQNALVDREPLVRLGAAQALAETPVPLRNLLFGVVNDPLLAIRATAGKGLAIVDKQSLSSEQQEQTRLAGQDYQTIQWFNAERPESQVNLGNFYSDSGQFAEAEAAYRTALRLEPKFMQAYINLADLKRRAQHEDEAEQLLKKAINLAPGYAAAHHALGLLLVRTQRMVEALSELKQAGRLDQATPQYDYVYAVALNDAGQSRQAITILKKLLQKFPNNQDVQSALIAYNQGLDAHVKINRHRK